MDLFLLQVRYRIDRIYNTYSRTLYKIDTISYAFCPEIYDVDLFDAHYSYCFSYLNYVLEFILSKILASVRKGTVYKTFFVMKLNMQKL